MGLREKMIEEELQRRGHTEAEIDRVLNQSDATGGQYSDGSPAPTDVPYPEYDPNNPIWDDKEDYDQWIKAQISAQAAIEDPMAALVRETSLQNEWEREQYENQQGKRDELAQSGAGTLAAAGQTADALNAAIVGNMVNQGTAIGQEIDYGKYVGDAASDPTLQAYQYGALGEFANRAQGGFTPVERAQMEMNRRMQERDLRGQQEAQMRNMQMRGARSSGLEVAQMLGAQQGGAERRMLQDMQQAAQAQQRADRMLEAGAGYATDVRTEQFAESGFNKQLQSQYQNQQARHRQNERNRQWDIVTDTSGAAAGAVADFYAHSTAPVTFQTETALGQPVTQPTGSKFSDAIGKVAGAEQADKAADALDDDPFFKIGPFSI